MRNQFDSEHLQSTKNNIMKAFVAVSALLAAAVADQTSHQVISHGHGPVVSHGIHKPHLGHAVAHPVHPVHVPVPPVHVPAPIVHKPVVHKPAPAPYHAPAPAPYHAPVVHKPAPYHPEPAYDEPAVYQYGYAVADDYSKANFAQNENRDGYATHGEYRVALPDGRTQIVTYKVADGYSGYVADVRYEGEAHYEPYHPAKPVHPAPAPAYHA